jgi:hypothetical protein
MTRIADRMPQVLLLMERSNKINRSLKAFCDTSVSTGRGGSKHRGQALRAHIETSNSRRKRVIDGRLTLTDCWNRSCARAMPTVAVRPRSPGCGKQNFPRFGISTIRCDSEECDEGGAEYLLEQGSELSRLLMPSADSTGGETPNASSTGW